MLYGMTTRFRCADPQPVWRVWDAFGIETAEMIGYWEASLTLILSLRLSLSLSRTLALALTRRRRSAVPGVHRLSHPEEHEEREEEGGGREHDLEPAQHWVHLVRGRVRVLGLGLRIWVFFCTRFWD